jgi:hypothetical protein
MQQKRAIAEEQKQLIAQRRHLEQVEKAKARLESQHFLK